MGHTLVLLIAEAERRGYVTQIVREEGLSAGTVSKRPALLAALEALKTGEASALFAVRMDRLCRSALDFLTLFNASQKQGWELVFLDSGSINHTTPQGQAMLTISAAMAQLEKDLIGLRTKEGLAQRKREGVTLGRKQRQPVEIVERVARERSEGKSLRAIAAGLTADGIPTSQGGKAWHASSISKVLARVAA